MKTKEKITKQELVDYAVSKKIQEIEAKRDKHIEERDSTRTEMDAIKNEFNEEREKAIAEEYADVIAAMAKKGNTYKIHTKESKTANMAIMGIIYATGNIVIEFIKEGKEDRMGRMGWNPMLKNIFIENRPNSIIIVDKDEITNEILEELNDRIKMLEKNYEETNYEINYCTREIGIIEHKKQDFKSEIIKQALAMTEDGTKLLQALENIDFQKVKMAVEEKKKKTKRK